MPTPQTISTPDTDPTANHPSRPDLLHAGEYATDQNLTGRTVFTKAFTLRKEDMEVIEALKRERNLLGDSAALRAIISEWTSAYPNPNKPTLGDE